MIFRMATIMRSFENHLPRRVITGRGTSEGLLPICQAHGWRRVIVTSDAGVDAAGLTARVTRPLQDAALLADTFADVPPEPPIAVVDELAARIVAVRADAVIAIGGGSVMDAVKVASLCARHGKPARDFLGIGKAGSRGLPTVLIPTTAGTGSEATFVAILTDETTGNKAGVVDPCLLPDVAIVDPALTDGLPQHVTAAAGMDAMVHAVEAFIARNATPIARGLALEAARHLGQWLEVACRDPGCHEARDGMAIGSHLAGMAFANASCCAVHALALPLGGRFQIPHGVITGCFVGEMMRHNASASGADIALFGAALGWGALPAAAFADRLDDIAADIGLRAALRRTHVPATAIPEMAAAAVANRRLMDPNPREVTVADASRIYQTVLQIAP